MSTSISKSDFLRASQCEKRLYLHKHKKHLASPPEEKHLSIMNMGTAVGELARKRYPGGVLVSAEFQNSKDDYKAALIESTKKLMESDVPAIFEASFEYQGLFVRVDIMQRTPKGWSVYEVKASTNPKKKHLDDLALQVYVLKGLGVHIKRAGVLLMNKRYVKQGELNLMELFKFKDFTKKSLMQRESIAWDLKHYQEVVDREVEPEVPIGPHCTSPYECEFRAHCWSGIPRDSILSLSGNKTLAWAFWEEGITRMENISANQLLELTPMQRLHVQAQKDGMTYVDEIALDSFLSDLNGPIHFLDFETFASAVPMYDGSGPYDQIPFQFSMHLLRDGQLLHRSFLADASAGEDPRSAFCEALLSAIEPEGDILVYNISFERRIIQELAHHLEEFAVPLNRLIHRMKDLIDPFSERMVYHPKMKGKTSIKNVLPALVPSMSYEHLDIANGAAASFEFAQLMQYPNVENHDEIREQLHRYCEQDTLAMVEILRVLKDLLKDKTQ